MKNEYIKSKKDKTQLIINNKYIYNFYTKEAEGRKKAYRLVDFKKSLNVLL